MLDYLEILSFVTFLKVGISYCYQPVVRNDVKVSVCQCVSNILLLFLPSLKNMFNVNSISVAPNNMSNIGRQLHIMILFYLQIIYLEKILLGS